MTRPPQPDLTDRVLRDVLLDEGEAVAPSRILEDVFARTRRERQAWRRPWDPGAGWRPMRRTLALVLVGALLAATVWLIGVGGGGPSPQVTPRPTAVPSGPPISSPLPAAAAACGNGAGLSFTGTTLWVACPGGVQPINIGVQPPAAQPLLAGVGLPSTGGAGTWGIGGAGLVELDSSGSVLRSLPLRDAAMLAVGGASIFVVAADGSLRSIDPKGGAELAQDATGAGPLAILATPDSVWIGGADGLVRRFDARSLAPRGTYPAGAKPARLAATSTAIYALSLGGDGILTRIDLATSIATSGFVGDAADPPALAELAATETGVWVTRRDVLLHVDPQRLVSSSPVSLPAYPAGLVVIGADAWIYASPGRIDRITLP